MRRRPITAPGLTLDQLEHDGPWKVEAGRWIRSEICATCMAEPAVDDELGRNCIRALTRKTPPRRRQIPPVST